MKPGESGKIPIKVRTKNYSGTLTKSVRVFTNCTDSNSTVVLKVTGTVWQAVQVTPRGANFGRLTAGELGNVGLVRKLTVENNVGNTLNLTDLHSDNPAFRLESKILEPGKKAEITVTLVPPLNVGSTRGKIRASTGVPEKPQLELIASAYVVAQVQVTPQRINVNTDQAAPARRYVTIRNTAKTPMKVTDLQVSNTAIKAKLDETTPGKNFRITIDIPAGTKLATTGEVLSFKTDNAKHPEFSIPIVKTSIVRRPPTARPQIPSESQLPPQLRQFAKPTKAKTPSVPAKAAGSSSVGTAKPTAAKTGGKKPTGQ